MSRSPPQVVTLCTEPSICHIPRHPSGHNRLLQPDGPWQGGGRECCLQSLRFVASASDSHCRLLSWLFMGSLWPGWVEGGLFNNPTFGGQRANNHEGRAHWGTASRSLVGILWLQDGLCMHKVRLSGSLFIPLPRSGPKSGPLHSQALSCSATAAANSRSAEASDRSEVQS